MIEDPCVIGRRPFRTPLAAQWWRFFNYLRIRCLAARSVETGKWWSDVDFYLPDLGVSVLAIDPAMDTPANLSCHGPALLLGPIPNPEVEGEWCWLGSTQVGGWAEPYRFTFSFRHVQSTGRIFTDHSPIDPPPLIALPWLDPTLKPDLEVRRAYWVAGTGSANSTGSRRNFGDPTASAGRPKASVVVSALERTDGELIEPCAGDFPPSGSKVVVYKHFDADGVLLYVGISDQPTRRGKTHASYSDWVEFAHSMTGRWCNSRREAEAVEEYLIRKLRPIFNRRHNHGPEARLRRAEYLTSKGRLSLIDVA